MKFEGPLNHFENDNEESAAGTYTEEAVVIADNIVHGNAILIKKIEFDLNDPQDIPAAGAGAEQNEAHVARKSKTAIQDISDDDVIAQHRVFTYGDGVDALFSDRSNLENPVTFGDEKADGIIFPYKYMYFAVKSSNAASTATARTRVWYYPITLSDKELSEVTQEAIINA